MQDEVRRASCASLARGLPLTVLKTFVKGVDPGSTVERERLERAWPWCTGVRFRPKVVPLPIDLHVSTTLPDARAV